MSSTSYYAGPNRPRIDLSSWEDVVIAAESGVLGESAWFENKEAVPASSKPANLELARDLASLSIDGGLLLIGVGDHHEVIGTTDSAESLRTRIVQVAASRINPALYVEVNSLEYSHPSDATSRRIIVVVVPRSAGAPHMVDQRYWGRSSEGKRALSDHDVEDLMVRRDRRRALGENDLHNIENELGPLAEHPQHAHLSIAIVPLGASNLTLTEAIAGQYLPQILNQAADFRASWSPWESGLGNPTPHPDGMLLRSDNPALDISMPEELSYRCLLRDDGAVLFLNGAATMQMEHKRLPETEGIVCGLILESLHSTCRLAGYLASEYLGYWGEWQAGLAVMPLKGRYSTSRFYGNYGAQPYPKSDYLRTTGATTRELTDQPAAVTTRLIEPLLRTLGERSRFLPYSNGAEILTNNQKGR